MSDILIHAGYLLAIDCGEGDLTAVPPEASLIESSIWADMCAEAGGEDALIASLGVVDERERDEP